jgi:hypothetical protein
MAFRGQAFSSHSSTSSLLAKEMKLDDAHRLSSWSSTIHVRPPIVSGSLPVHINSPPLPSFNPFRANHHTLLEPTLVYRRFLTRYYLTATTWPWCPVTTSLFLICYCNPQFSLSPDPRTWGADLSPNLVEEDDALHDPQELFKRDKQGKRIDRAKLAFYSNRGFLNLGCLLILICGLLALLSVFLVFFFAKPNWTTKNRLAQFLLFLFCFVLSLLQCWLSHHSLCQKFFRFQTGWLQLGWCKCLRAGTRYSWPGSFVFLTHCATFLNE